MLLALLRERGTLLFRGLLLSSLELSNTKVYEPQIRALLGTASHFCQVGVLKLRTVPIAGVHAAGAAARAGHAALPRRGRIRAHRCPPQGATSPGVVAPQASRCAVQGVVGSGR